MSRSSPILSEHEQLGALLETYGPPPTAAPGAGPQPAAVRVVQAFGDPDPEYAAIRTGCGLIDLPMRGCLEIRGGDRIEFLNRMLTQELKPWVKSGEGLGEVRESFWLSRRGRIDADLRLTNLADRVVAGVDIHAADRAVAGLGSYVIAEDCTISDISESMHTFGLHGPAACAVIAAAAEPGVAAAGAEIAGKAVDVATLAAGRAITVRIAGHEVVVSRVDVTGEIGLELFVPAAGAAAIWHRLLQVGGAPAPGQRGHGRGPVMEFADQLPPLPAGAAFDPFGPSRPPFHMRPIGWAAFNVARIEAGTPLYMLDFGPDSLPHETSMLASRVSFTKGCYLGQEIVARMQALGQPKQRLVAMKLRLPASLLSTGADTTADADVPELLQPITGAGVFAAPAGLAPDHPVETIRAGECGDPIGAVTSSAISPMLGSTPVCFAMVKSVHAKAGASLLVDCGGGMLRGEVLESLRAWTR